MQRDNVTVTEKRTHYNLPRFEAIDIITVVAMVGALVLMLSDKPVPDYIIAIIGLGTGAKVYTENQLNKARNSTPDISKTD